MSRESSSGIVKFLIRVINPTFPKKQKQKQKMNQETFIGLRTLTFPNGTDKKTGIN